MRPFKTILTAAVLLVATTTFGEKPALPPANLIAHYPLNGTAADATATYSDMILINAPYEQGGIYLNGNYVGGDPDSSNARTPNINGLDFNEFTITAEFRVSEYTAGPFRMPVFVGGTSFRWIGVEMEDDGDVAMRYNNTGAPETTIRPSLDTWHTAAVTYDGTVGKMYIDGVLADSVTFALINGGDPNVTLSNGSIGRVFKGWFRELKIYNGVLETVPVRDATWGRVKSLYR